MELEHGTETLADKGAFAADAQGTVHVLKITFKEN